jgi:predicted HTH domain antitoxin
MVIPDEILTAPRMSEAEMHQKIAIMLFQKERLTLAQASRFAEVHRVAFQPLRHFLKFWHVPIPD